MKIAFLFKRDSHFKAVKSTALRLCEQYKCEPTFIGIESEYSPNNKIYTITYISEEDLAGLCKYDYVVACLGGYLLNRVISVLRDKDTKVISIFPGIVSHYQLDAFISRLNSDQVWLNSKSDFELYDAICKLFGYKNNSLLYGMSWLNLDINPSKRNNILKGEEVVFFEQTEILSSIQRKRRFSNLLEKIILLNPHLKFKYKIRNNSTDSYFSILRSRLNQFENVEVVEDLNCTDISRVKYYLSLSSSALIEGIAYGKLSYLMDKSLLDFDSKEFYKGSNIEMRGFILSSISEPMSNDWYRQRISLPLIYVDLFSFYKNKNHIVFEKRSFNFIRLMIFRLSFSYLKMVRLIFNKPRLKSIQKSLEYLSI